MYALPPANPAKRSAPLLPAVSVVTASTVSTLTHNQVAQSPQMVRTVEVSAPVIVQRVSVEPTQARSDLLVGAEAWTWSELRDYVIAEMHAKFGPTPRDQRKEYGIFNRFFNEFGPDAVAIARFAFGPVCQGWWGDAPISVNRFCRASDPYFSLPILERIRETA